MYVDMGRIILAFGQIKAAKLLKGTELRQLTEANIPMVDKLAERFSSLFTQMPGIAESGDIPQSDGGKNQGHRSAALGQPPVG